MAEKKISINVSDSIGKVSGKVIAPAKPSAVVTLAHGAGAGMDHVFMSTLCKELEKVGIATVRFNFPFTENKKGRPDPPAVAMRSIEAALSKTHELFPKLKVFAAGKSFGGRMSSTFLSKTSPDYVGGVVFYGFPLHAPGSPSIERGDHLKTVNVPLLFLQGTRDALAKVELITKVCKALPAATLVTFEGADHSFKAGKDNLLPKLAAMTAEWIGKIVL